MITERCIYTETITIDDETYEVICIPQDNGTRSMYEFYIQPANGLYTMEFMYGVPAEQQTLDEAFTIAAGNAPDYVEDFMESWT